MREDEINILFCGNREAGLVRRDSVLQDLCPTTGVGTKVFLHIGLPFGTRITHKRGDALQSEE